MATLVIEAGRSHREYWKDLWRYREFYVLAWRDVSVRYKQTAIGIVWALLGGTHTIEPHSFMLSLAVSAILLWFGIAFFRKMERSFADVI